MEKKIDNLVVLLTKSINYSTTPTTAESSTTTSATTTTATTTAPMERFFNDVFDEFEESIKEDKETKEKEKKEKKAKWEKANEKMLLIITLSTAGVGTTVLIMVLLFVYLCLNKEKKSGGQEERERLHIYDEVGPPAPPPTLASTEGDDDIPFIDEDEKNMELTPPVDVLKIKSGYIRKGEKGPMESSM